MRKTNSFCLLLLLISITTHAQEQRDTTYVSASGRWITSLYEKSLGSESPLYTGSDYAEYKPQADEHPFFLNDDWIMGSVTYNNYRYENVPLQFDIQSQKLLIEHLSSRKKIQLISGNASSFKISGHRFVWLSQETTEHFGEAAGFFDLLIDGDVKLYAKRIKTYKQVVVNDKFESRFDETVDFFYFKDQTFFPVKGKSSALKVLADKKSSLNQELKKSNVSFRKSREAALMKAAQIYNSQPD